jgi:hypothetical protein
VRRLSRKCGSLDVSLPYGSARPVTGIALPFLTRSKVLHLSRWEQIHGNYKQVVLGQNEFTCSSYREAQILFIPHQRIAVGLHKQGDESQMWSIKQWKATLLSNQPWQVRRSRLMKHLIRQCEQEPRTENGSYQIFKVSFSQFSLHVPRLNRTVHKR